MFSSIRLLSLTAIIVVLSGCDNDTRRIIRVTTQYPGATPQQVAETLAAPVENSLLGLPNVDSITSISTSGRLESYIEFTPDSRPDEMLARIAESLPTKQFPNEATAPSLKLLPNTESIPTVKPTDIDYIVFELNREKVANYGISVANVLSAMQEQASGSASDMSRLAKLHKVQVTAPNDRRVPLLELGEIRLEKQPTHIVTRWPLGE